MTDNTTAAVPDGGTTTTSVKLATRGTTRRNPASHGTKKPAKSRAGTLTVDEANDLHYEFYDIVWGIEHDFRALDELFDLLYGPNPAKELDLHYSGDVFRGIRDQVNALQACIRKVRDLGHMSKEAGDE